MSYYERNKEQVLTKAKKYYQDHKEDRRTYQKQYASDNREQVRKYDRERRRLDPRVLLLKDSKKRAKKKQLSHSITIDDIIIPESCPILGIPLFRGNKVATDNSPSIDRIDSLKGYVKGNVQIISWRANRIKSTASLEDLILLGEWAKRVPSI